MNTDITFMGIVEIISWIIGIVGIGGGVFSFLRYNNYKVTVQLQNDSIKALQDNKIITDEALAKAHLEIKELQIDSASKIGELTGQVKLYRDLNLKDIAEALSVISKSNAKILSTLQASAVILSSEKHGAGLLVKTVETQPLDVKPQ